MTTSTFDVRRAGDRSHTALPWLESHHSFSFPRHYDPANTAHGLRLVNNDAAISIRQHDAVLWGGRLRPGETVSVPDARRAHVFVARGAVSFDGAGRLHAGDAVRLTAAGSPHPHSRRNRRRRGPDLGARHMRHELAAT